MLKERRINPADYETKQIKKRLQHKKKYIAKLQKGSTAGYFKVYLYKLKPNLKPNTVYNIDANYLDHVFTYQGGLCSFTGQQLTTSGETNCATDAVIDLIDVTKGYVPGNVKLVARRIKFMKGPGMRPWMNDANFVELCKEVAVFDMLKKEVEEEKRKRVEDGKNSESDDDDENTSEQKEETTENNGIV